MIASAVVDWPMVINAVSAGTVLILTTWMGLKMKKAEMDRAYIKDTLGKVKKNTDGAITAALLVAAQSAERAAEATGKEEDFKIAIIARKAYDTQVLVQKSSETHDPEPS